MKDQALRLVRRLELLEQHVTRATGRTLKAHGERWRAAMVDKFQPWHTGFRHSGDSAIRRRSSDLARSMSARLTGDTLADMQLVESAGGTEAAHARLQEYGGTIVPRKGKWLAIPTELALTASGQPRRGYESPRNVPDLFFFQSDRDVAADRAWLVRSTAWKRASPALDSEVPRQVRGRAKPPQLEFLYMLLKRVTVPPRLGMRETEKALAPQRLTDFWGYLREEMRNGGPGPGVPAGVAG